MNHRLPLFCQRWREHRSSYRPAGETINTSDFEIAPIPKPVAKLFVQTHHYSKSFVAARYTYGLFSRHVTEDHWQTQGLAPQLAGVAAFSVSQHPAVVTNVFPGNPKDSVELGRFVLLDHIKANAETYFLSRCHELLKKEGIRGVVAFSDPEPRTSRSGNTIWPGHYGIIYHAGNSVFLGKSSPKTLYIFDDCSTLDRRTISKIRNHESGFKYACKLLTDRSADEPWPDSKAWLDYWLPRLTTKRFHRGNFRFAWSLCNRVYPRGTRLPYPKQFASAHEMEIAKEKAVNQQTET